MTQYYFIKDGNKKGPFSKEELSRQAISPETLVWFHPLDNWTRLSDITDLSGLIQSKESRSVKSRLDFFSVMVGISISLVIFLLWNTIERTAFDERTPVTTTIPPADLHRDIAASAFDSDVDFDMYVEKFYRDASAMNINLVRPTTTTIKLAPLSKTKGLSHFRGVSFGANDDQRIEIYIDSTTWEKFNKPMRYVLMYHELAHDVLNLRDLDLTGPNEKKLLMYPALADYRSFTMDEFIESYQKVFTEYKLENP